jgi:hypothetical protein
LIEIGRDVCSWHLADIDFDAERVCLGSQSGHSKSARLRLLMSHSGHPARLEVL